MYRSFFALLLLLILFACQNTPTSPVEEPVLGENVFHARYSPDNVQKMHWLAGAWKGEEAGRPVRQSFQFHGGNALEVLFMDNNGRMNTFPLVWDEGCYYFGQYRQWVVTWIGEKDVRFEPVRPGLAPMTWTRLNDQKWHLVRHLTDGDEIIEMERANEMQP